MLKNIFLTGFAIVAVFFVSSLSAETGGSQCGPFFEVNCGECHEVKKACDLFGITKEEWQEVFTAMKEMGADIPEEDLKLLSECLVNPGDEMKKVCGK